jgi:hypothetical protein
MYVPVDQHRLAHSVNNSTINTVTAWSASKSRMEWIKQRIKRRSESEFTCPPWEKPCFPSSTSDFSPRGRIGDHSKARTHPSWCCERKFIQSVQTFHRKGVKGSGKVSWVVSNEMPTRRKRTTVYESSKSTSTPPWCFRGRLCLSQARSRYGNESHRFQTSSRP